MRPHNKKRLIWFVFISLTVWLIVFLGTTKPDIKTQAREIILDPEKWLEKK